MKGGGGVLWLLFLRWCLSGLLLGLHAGLLGGSLVVCPAASGDFIADEDQADPPLGISLRAGARDLRREALSINHLMTHVPKNPYCEACRVAKRQFRPHLRGGAQRVRRDPPERFGDEVTADHIIVRAAHSQGIHGEQTCLVIADRATGYWDAFPLVDKTAASALWGINEFMGPRRRPA